VRNRRTALDPVTFFRAVLGHAEIGPRMKPVGFGCA
jgi:hypothetical protein